MRPPRDWWKTFFSRAYPLGELVSERDTEREVRELLRLLPAAKGVSILDVGCGIGRHSLALARRGYRVTGVDYTPAYLSRARRSARRVGSPARFLRRDMRALGFEGAFEAAICLWTSFGYFPRLADDARTLRGMRRALRPGGWLALELVDGERFMGGIAPRSWEYHGGVWTLLAEELRLGRDPAIVSERIFIGPKGRVRRGRTFVRLYTRARLRAALRKAGFSRVLLSSGLLDGLEGGPPRRILALAKR